MCLFYLSHLTWGQFISVFMQDDNVTYLFLLTEGEMEDSSDSRVPGAAATTDGETLQAGDGYTDLKAESENLAGNQHLAEGGQI